MGASRNGRLGRGSCELGDVSGVVCRDGDCLLQVASMAAKKSNPAMDYIVSRLKKNPEVAYADVKEGAEAKKLTVHPIMYGRAKLLLGMVKPGKGKAAKKKAKKAKGAKATTRKTGKKTGRRGPGRPRKAGGRGRSSAAGNAIDSIQALAREVQAQGRENEALRSTLEKLRDLIDSAL